MSGLNEHDDGFEEAFSVECLGMVVKMADRLGHPRQCLRPCSVSGVDCISYERLFSLPKPEYGDGCMAIQGATKKGASIRPRSRDRTPQKWH